MTAKVVDASILAAILFGEPEAAQAITLIGHADMVAPELLKFEIANLRKSRLISTGFLNCSITRVLNTRRWMLSRRHVSRSKED